MGKREEGKGEEEERREEEMRERIREGGRKERNRM